MSDLLARLKASSTAIATVDIGLPNAPVVVGLRILNEQDYQDAGFAAQDLLTKREADLNMMTAELAESEKTTQLLARMVVDPETGKRLFDSPAAVRETLSRDQRATLSAAYLEHEKSHAPSERTMPDADFAELIEALKKTPQVVSLNDLSFATLKKLLLALAAQPIS